MEAPRRRSIMPQAADNNNGGGGTSSRMLSSIPMPATVRKPQHGNPMRMSVANNSSLRTPYSGPPGGGGASFHPRQSMARSQAGNHLLMSVSKQNQNGGRTPLAHAGRRTSMWPGQNVPGSSSTGAASATLKDPRPIREKAHQSKMRSDIVSYLQRAGLDIVPQILTNIQAKDFRSIFNFLIGTLDPDFPFDPNLDFSVKFDDKERKDAQARGRETEFLDAISAMHYPFSSSIDRKWIASPGAQYSWPVLLALLHWLVELCKARDEYFSGGDPTTQIVQNIPDEFDDPREHRALAFEYFEEAYIQWLDEVDEPVEAQESLEAKYAKKNERIQLDLEEKQELLRQADKEYKTLKANGPPIQKLKEQNEMLNADSQKFDIIYQKLTMKRDKVREFIQRETADLEERTRRLEEMRQEQQRVAEVVKSQNLSVQEVEEMRRDHEFLTKQLDDLEQKRKDAIRTVMSLEVMFTNRAGEAEDAVDAYMIQLSNLRLYPQPPPPWDSVQLALELKSGAQDPGEMLSGADISNVIKPTLLNIAEAKRKERAENENERIRLENELDKLTAECENREDELVVLEKQVVSINEQAEALREAAQQDAMVAGQEAARLEKDLASMRNAALATGMGVKSRLQALSIDYREQMERVARLKDDTIGAILKSGNEIAGFKDEVSRYLVELKEFAETT